MSDIAAALAQALGLGSFLNNIHRAEPSPAVPGLILRNLPSAQPAGLLQPGNIDLNHRPVVRNPDGSYSTVRSVSFNMDGHEVLVPTVTPDGRVVSNQEALAMFQRTGQHLGIFDSPRNADAYAQTLHNQQAQQYAPPPPPRQFPASPVAQAVPMPVAAGPRSTSTSTVSRGRFS